MALLDLFRSQPEWKHADPEVRAAAVRRLPAGEQQLLADIAREDADARVRRAAVRRLSAAETLAAIGRSDADESVRREALEALAELAQRSNDAAVGLAALDALSDPRTLASLAREAQHADVRRAALLRLEDPRALASLARNAEDPAVQVAAVERLSDAALLLDLALKSEQKAVALAAVERLREPDALRAVAERARHRGAARRAGSRLAEVLPAPAPAAAPPPEVDDEAERQRWEQAQAAERQRRAEVERQVEAQAQALAARRELIEGLTALHGAEAGAGLAAARSAWEALQPVEGAEAEELARRFLAACAECEERTRETSHAESARPQVEALAAEAEAAAALPDVGEARAQLAKLERRWQALGGATAAFSAERERFLAAQAALRTRDEQGRAETRRRAAESRGRLETLCAALEALLQGTHPSLKEGERLLRESRQALEAPPPAVAKPEREALLARLKTARQALYPRVQQWREDAEWKRWASGELREDLLRQVETLATAAAGEGADWERLDRERRELESQWKRALTGARAVGDDLVARWNAAHDPLRARCETFMATRHEEWERHRQRKEELIAQAEALAESSEWLKTAEQLQRLQAEWKTVGATHPRHAKVLWERFRKPCDRFFTRRKADLDQRKQAWHQSLERKHALIARAEELARSSDWEAAAAELKQLQAEWKASGAVRRSQSEAVWKRFRAACDAFFERFKNRDQLASQAALEERERCLELARGWLPAAGGPAEAPDGLLDQWHALQARWRQARAHGPAADALEERLLAVRQELVSAYPESFRGSELDPEAALKRREKVVEKAEALAATLEPASPGGSAVSMADQLRQALAANALGGRKVQEERQRGLADELAHLRASWSHLPPVPGEVGRQLQRRFEGACQRIRQAGRAPRSA